MAVERTTLCFSWSSSKVVKQIHIHTFTKIEKEVGVHFELEMLCSRHYRTKSNVTVRVDQPHYLLVRYKNAVVHINCHITFNVTSTQDGFTTLRRYAHMHSFSDIKRPCDEEGLVVKVEEDNEHQHT